MERYVDFPNPNGWLPSEKDLCARLQRVFTPLYIIRRQRVKTRPVFAGFLWFPYTSVLILSAWFRVVYSSRVEPRGAFGHGSDGLE